MESVHAVVIGAGQAGLATSHELAARGIEHVVLDAGRIGETWRTRRWRSFRVVSPNWINALPGFAYAGDDPDGFAPTAELVAFLEAYAASFRAPLRLGVRVEAIERDGDGDEYVLRTSSGLLGAREVVVATGAFGAARVPALASNLPASVTSIHTDDYWAPEDLPPGNVLVVGAGQSGLQLAYELLAAGRGVTVSVGRHGWVPRRLWGRDQNWWRLENGDFRTVVADPDRPVIDYPFTPLSRWGVDDFNVRTVWEAGGRLVGHVAAIDGPNLSLAPDLAELLEAGDAFATAFVARIRAFARNRGEDVPEHEMRSAWRPGEIPAAPANLDLEAEGISTVIWSTGYRQDFSWIRVPGALAENGAPFQRQGVSPVRGLHFVGMHRLWEGAAGTILGCGWAATNVAEVIAARP